MNMKIMMSAASCAAMLFLSGCCCFHCNAEVQKKVSTPEQKKNMERVCRFLKKAKFYFIATMDKDQPRVRPFGTIHIYDGKLYIQTGKKKNVSKQLAKNGKVEICAFKNGEWIRLSGTLVNDDRREAKTSLLNAYPELKSMYSADDSNTQVLYFKNATATFNSFTKPMETVQF